MSLSIKKPPVFEAAVNIEGIYKELWRVSVKGSLTNTGMLSNHNFNDCWC